MIVRTKFGTFLLDRNQLSKLHNALIQSEDMYLERGEFAKAKEVRTVLSALWNKILDIKCREDE
jgi:hypothetical protein